MEVLAHLDIMTRLRLLLITWPSHLAWSPAGMVWHGLAKQGVSLQPQLESQTAAAAVLGVSIRTFYRMQDDKALGYPKPVFIKGRKFFYVEERIAWVEKQKELRQRAA